MTDPIMTTLNPTVGQSEVPVDVTIPDLIDPRIGASGTNARPAVDPNIAGDNINTPKIDIESIFKNAEKAAKKELVSPAKSIFTINTDRYKGFNLSEDLITNINEVEYAGAASQPWYSTVWKDLKVTGANAAGMFLATYTTIFDDLKNNSLLASPDSLTASIGRWRNSVQENNENFMSRRQAESPLLSIITTTNGLGELIKSAAYGVGVAAGMGSQIYLTGGILSGVGAMARGARIAPAVAKTVRTLMNSKDTASVLVKALNLSKGASGAVNAANIVTKGINLAKTLVPSYLGAYGEAAFEGLESSEKLKVDKMAEYYDIHNTFPDADYEQKIEKVAHDAFDARFSMNIGLLMLSNIPFLKIVGSSGKTISKGLERAASYGYIPRLGEHGKVVFDKIGANIAPSTAKGWLPRILHKTRYQTLPALSMFLKRHPIEVSEGLEELYQFWVGESVDNYYSSMLDLENNAVVERSAINNALGLFTQMGRDTDRLFTTEAFKSALSGIISGTGQNAIAKLMSSYKLARDNEGKLKLVNIGRENREKFEKSIPALEDALTSGVKDYLNTMSITGTTPAGFSNTVKGLNSLYNNLMGSSSADEVGIKQTQWASLFMNTYDGVLMGQSDILSEIFSGQISDMSLEDFNGLLGDSGIANVTQEEKDSIVKNIQEEISKIHKAVEKVNTVMNNPFMEGTVAHEYYKELQKLAAYHTYMAENSREFSENYSNNTSLLAKEGMFIEALTPGIESKEAMKAEKDLLTEEAKTLKSLISSSEPGDTGLGALNTQLKAVERKLEILDKLFDDVESLSLSADQIGEMVAELKGYSKPSKQEILDAINIFKLRETNNKHSKIVEDLLSFDPSKKDAAEILSKYIIEANSIRNNIDGIKRQSKILNVKELLKDFKGDPKIYQKAFSKMILSNMDKEEALKEAEEEVNGNNSSKFVPPSGVTPKAFVSTAYDSELMDGIKEGDYIVYEDVLGFRVLSVDSTGDYFTLTIAHPSNPKLKVIELVYTKDNSRGAVLNISEDVIDSGPNKTFIAPDSKKTELTRSAFNLTIHPILATKADGSFVFSLEDFPASTRAAIEEFRKAIKADPEILGSSDPLKVLAGYNLFSNLMPIISKYRNNSILEEQIEKRKKEAIRRKEEEERKKREEEERKKREEEERKKKEEEERKKKEEEEKRAEEERKKKEEEEKRKLEEEKRLAALSEKERKKEEARLKKEEEKRKKAEEKAKKKEEEAKRLAEEAAIKAEMERLAAEAAAAAEEEKKRKKEEEEERKRLREEEKRRLEEEKEKQLSLLSESVPEEEKDNIGTSAVSDSEGGSKWIHRKLNGKPGVTGIPSSISSKAGTGIFFLEEEEDKTGIFIKQLTPQDPTEREDRKVIWAREVNKARKEGLGHLKLVEIQIRRPKTPGKKGFIYYFPTENLKLLVVENDSRLNVGLTTDTEKGKASFIELKDPRMFKIHSSVTNSIIKEMEAKGIPLEKIKEAFTFETEAELDNQIFSLLTVARALYNTNLGSLEDLASYRRLLAEEVFNVGREHGQDFIDNYFTQILALNNSYETFLEEYTSNPNMPVDRIREIYDIDHISFDISSEINGVKRPFVPLSENKYPLFTWEGVTYDNLIFYNDVFYTRNSEGNYEEVRVPRSLRKALFPDGTASGTFLVVEVKGYDGVVKPLKKHIRVNSEGSDLSSLLTQLNNEFKHALSDQKKGELANEILKSYIFNLPSEDSSDTKNLFILKVSKDRATFLVKYKNSGNSYNIIIESDGSGGYKAVYKPIVLSSDSKKIDKEKTKELNASDSSYDLRMLKRREFQPDILEIMDYRMNVYTFQVKGKENIGVTPIVPEDIEDSQEVIIEEEESLDPEDRIEIDDSLEEEDLPLSGKTNTIIKDFLFNKKQYSINVENALKLGLEKGIITKEELPFFFDVEGEFNAKEVKLLVKEGLLPRISVQELIKEGILSDNTNPSFRDVAMITPEIEEEINRLINICVR